MAYLFRITSLSIIIALYIFPEVPKRLALSIYIILVAVRAYQKIGDYKDSKEKIEKDSEIEILNEEKKGALNGANRSSNFDKGIQNMKRNTEYKRRKDKRNFVKELVETIILK